MDLTTAARVKERLGLTASDTSEDAIIASLITRVSAEAEVLMNRHAESTSRTVQLTVDDWQTLSLPGYPITSVTSIHNDADRNFGAETLIATSDYYVESASGLIFFEVGLVRGPGVMQVIYTGGMSDSTANFIAAFPDIAEAVDQRVSQLWQRRSEVGVSSVATGQGSVSAQTVDWIPDALRVIDSYRRLGRV